MPFSNRFAKVGVARSALDCALKFFFLATGLHLGHWCRGRKPIDGEGCGQIPYVFADD